MVIGNWSFNVIPLGQNQNGYHGERIDIASVLRDCLAAAEEHGWEIRWLETESSFRLLTLHRTPQTAQHERECGGHGFEPRLQILVHPGNSSAH